MLGRRPGLRLAVILLVILALVLLGYLFWPRSVDRILVADVPEHSPESARVVDEIKLQDILKRARDEEPALLIFVAKPDENGDIARRAGNAGALVDWLKSVTSPRVALVVSPAGAEEVAKDLSPDARSLDAGFFLAEQRRSPRPGLVPATLWGLALLATGALFARALMAPRTVSGARPAATGSTLPLTPSVPPDRRWSESSNPPARSGEGVVVADWPGTSRATARSAPQRGEIDLSRFPVRDETPGWTPQCPYCGAFHLRKARPDNADAGYRCSSCGEAWHLAEGASWPTVVVNPRHRRAN
jgi:hypothetical protein